MRHLVLKNAPVVLFLDNQGGLVLERTAHGMAVLAFTGAGFSLRFLNEEEAGAAEVTNLITGPIGMLEVAFTCGASAIDDNLKIDDFTFGDDEEAERLVLLAITNNHVWLGIRAACAIRDPNVVARMVITKRPDIPDVIRVACLPVAAQIPIIGGSVVQELIEQAHSRNWPADDAPEHDRSLAMTATTIAYIYAKQHGIPYDDHAGTQRIGSEGMCSEIVRDENVAWINESVMLIVL